MPSDPRPRVIPRVSLAVLVAGGVLLASALAWSAEASPVAQETTPGPTNGQLDSPTTALEDPPDEQTGPEEDGAARQAAHGEGDEQSVAPTPLEAEYLELINASRVEAGQEPLEWDSVLTQIARAHNQDMLDRGYFDNVSPEGEDPGGRLRRAGLRVSYWAENLSIDHRSIAEAHESDMSQPEVEGNHRFNLLDARVHRAGIAIAQRPDGRLLITVMFTP